MVLKGKKEKVLKGLQEDFWKLATVKAKTDEKSERIEGITIVKIKGKTFME